LPKELAFRGPVNVDLKASDSGGGVHARIDARSNRGTVVYRPPGGKPVESDYQDFTLSATYANDVARADFSVNSDHGGTAAYVEIANVSGESPIRPIIGHIDVDIPDIAFVNGFLPDFEGIQGRLAIDADLDGDLKAPRVYGQARLRDGLARLPEPGLELRGINLTAYSRGSDRLVLRGEAHSGKGSIDVAGELGLNPQAGWPFEMHIMGKNFQVVRLSEAQAVASPDLLVRGEHGRIEVTGTVMLPEAVLEFEELPNSAISPSPDQVILSSPGDASSRKKPKDLAITSRVDVMLGEDVTFSGFGLETQLIGDLELRSRPGKPPTARGAITLKKGSYKAYGQNLTIQRGRFLFRGPVDNPSLDIRAIRKSGTVTAGIAVTGTLKDPRTRVFSEPPMSDADALAYLLTGKPLSEASSSEGDAIEGAALSMGLKAAVPITGRMAQALGLDELSMKSDGGFEKTSLLVGKYLAPDLYVSYVRGLFDKLDTFKLKYQLTEHISVEAESGTSQGADLVYSIERD
jgi:translocation and assembly module TamB